MKNTINRFFWKKLNVRRKGNFQRYLLKIYFQTCLNKTIFNPTKNNWDQDVELVRVQKVLTTSAGPFRFAGEDSDTLPFLIVLDFDSSMSFCVKKYVKKTLLNTNPS